ncbi:hypothetical protein ACQKMV_00400 [Lysinibacillus sp. NPDC094403]|uniref:hypothetical protein n=1 Tax=Lysinibacillus sp. NPDC094403 TaxID=3390581 RepID=UPI003D01C656
MNSFLSVHHLIPMKSVLITVDDEPFYHYSIMGLQDCNETSILVSSYTLLERLAKFD